MIGVVGFEVGSEFFVQNLCTLIGAESLWVPTEAPVILAVRTLLDRSV
jgi:hypothetical protein